MSVFGGSPPSAARCGSSHAQPCNEAPGLCLGNTSRGRASHSRTDLAAYSLSSHQRKSGSPVPSSLVHAQLLSAPSLGRASGVLSSQNDYHSNQQSSSKSLPVLPSITPTKGASLSAPLNRARYTANETGLAAGVCLTSLEQQQTNSLQPESFRCSMQPRASSNGATASDTLCPLLNEVSPPGYSNSRLSSLLSKDLGNIMLNRDDSNGTCPAPRSPTTGNAEKKHKCGFCFQGFARRHDRDRHERMHTGEKPYDCGKCGKRFMRSDALSRHRLIEPHCGHQGGFLLHSERDRYAEVGFGQVGFEGI